MTFFRRQIRTNLPDLLIAHADALIAGSLEPDKLFEPYHEIDASQVEPLLNLAGRLNDALVPVQPSDEFVEDLRRRLNEAVFLEHFSWWQRIRKLPPRVQIAAGISGATLAAAGVVLVARRPVLSAVSDWRNR